MLLAVVLWGAITWYDPSSFGTHVACGMPTSRIVSPWVAVDSSEIARGSFSFGDEAWVYVPGHPPLKLPVLDTGPLYDYYIEDYGREVPIVADVHMEAWPNGDHSALGYVINHSRAERELLKHVKE